jgi:hypothetical protein
MVVSFNSFCQGYKKDIVSVSKYFIGLKNYSMNIEYKLFIDNVLTKPYQERVVKLKRNNKSVHMTQGTSLEILDNEVYQIMVDSKNLVFSARKKFKEDDRYDELKEFNSFMDMNIDSLFFAYEKIKVIEQSAERVKYEMTFKPNDEMEKTILTVNKIRKYYESVVVKYKKPVKINELDGKYHVITMEIKYTEFKPNGVSNMKIFDEKNYISIDKNGKANPLKKYSNYKIIIPEDEI